MEKVTRTQYRRRKGIVVSETKTEAIHFDKYDHKQQQPFNFGLFIAIMAVSFAITALAVLMCKVLF